MIIYDDNETEITKQSIKNKLINNEYLTEFEIEYMINVFKKVHRSEIEQAYCNHNLVFTVLELGEDLYYKVKHLVSNHEYVDNRYENQPYRVKKEVKTFEVFVPYDNN